jgi:hypothetical protein
VKGCQMLDPDDRAVEVRMSQKFGTFSTIQISDDLPCEVVPLPGQKALPFSAEEESFFDAGFALVAVNDEPDALDDLAPEQPAPRSRVKRLMGSLVAFVTSLWSRAIPPLARAKVTLVAFVTSLWSRARIIFAGRLGSLVRHAFPRWGRQGPDDEVARRRSLGSRSRGRHGTLLGYPALSREL